MISINEFINYNDKNEIVTIDYSKFAIRQIDTTRVLRDIL